jgi:hypothetical protein
LCVTLFFRKAIFLYLCIISFSVVSGNAFSASARERCEAEWVNTSVAACIEAKLHCDDLIYYFPPISNVSAAIEECKSQSCNIWVCLPMPGTTCKHFFAHYKDEPVINIGTTFYDEGCIEPNPDETPPDPLADQLNDVSLPNECRGE